MSDVAIRDSILKLEDALKTQKQVELPCAHHFADGVYARELLIPKGTVLTGKIHKYECINFLTMGVIRVANGGEETKTIVAPYTFVSPPGTKRAGFALEDSIWITVHRTDSKDLEDIEAEMIVTDFDQLTHEGKLCLG